MAGAGAVTGARVYNGFSFFRRGQIGEAARRSFLSHLKGRGRAIECLGKHRQARRSLLLPQSQRRQKVHGLSDQNLQLWGHEDFQSRLSEISSKCPELPSVSMFQPSVKKTFRRRSCPLGQTPNSWSTSNDQQMPRDVAIRVYEVPPGIARHILTTWCPNPRSGALLRLLCSLQCHTKKPQAMVTQRAPLNRCDRNMQATLSMRARLFFFWLTFWVEMYFFDQPELCVCMFDGTNGFSRKSWIFLCPWSLSVCPFLDLASAIPKRICGEDLPVHRLRVLRSRQRASPCPHQTSGQSPATARN